MEKNKNAMTMYNSDQKKERILKLLEKEGGKNGAVISKEVNLHWQVCKNTLMRMYDEQLITREKYLCEKSKRYVWRYYSANTGYVARTYEQCLQKLRDMHTHDEQPKGKYDDIINKNPNLRVYAGKTSLFETKDKDYFLNGQKDKVNRAAGTTWGYYETA